MHAAVDEYLSNMSRKPSIILTTADKKAVVKDIRAELRAAKAKFKEHQTVIKAATRAAAQVEKQIAFLEARIQALR